MIALLLLFGAFSKLAPDAQAASASIRHIRVEYDRIHRTMSRMRRVERYLEDRTTEGGSLEGYFDRSSLRRLVAAEYGCGGRWATECYFEHDRLIFGVITTIHYKHPISEPGDPGISSNEQERFYLRNGRLIRWIDSSGSSHSATETASEERRQRLLSDVRELLNVLHGPPNIH